MCTSNSYLPIRQRFLGTKLVPLFIQYSCFYVGFVALGRGMRSNIWEYAMEILNADIITYHKSRKQANIGLLPAFPLYLI